MWNNCLFAVYLIEVVNKLAVTSKFICNGKFLCKIRQNWLNKLLKVLIPKIFCE